MYIKRFKIERGTAREKKNKKHNIIQDNGVDDEILVCTNRILLLDRRGTYLEPRNVITLKQY